MDENPWKAKLIERLPPLPLWRQVARGTLIPFGGLFAIFGCVIVLGHAETLIRHGQFNSRAFVVGFIFLFVAAALWWLIRRIGRRPHRLLA